MFDPSVRLRKPGLFVTATGTGVGKTLVTCAIAAALRQQAPGARLGVCKPVATGCRHDREGLVSEDAEALAHFADCRQSLTVVNPVRYRAPLAPAVAAERTGTPVDWAAIARSLRLLDDASDFLLVEGVGGILAPLDAGDPQRTVLDLMAALAYPALVVADAGLGTLNHTAMTVRLLRQAGCAVAGLAVNRFQADSSGAASIAADLSMSSNRQWLMKMTGLPVLATVPACPAAEVAPQKGLIPPAALEAVALTYWPEVLAPPRRRSPA